MPHGDGAHRRSSSRRSTHAARAPADALPASSPPRPSHWQPAELIRPAILPTRSQHASDGHLRVQQVVHPQGRIRRTCGEVTRLRRLGARPRHRDERRIGTGGRAIAHARLRARSHLRARRLPASPVRSIRASTTGRTSAGCSAGRWWRWACSRGWRAGPRVLSRSVSVCLTGSSNVMHDAKPTSANVIERTSR